ncbi:MAG: extracellular solute-binding protein [Clostridia bacterium]|nr:extracellular solute-binding protein [Clostridia bacterium]
MHKGKLRGLLGLLIVIAAVVLIVVLGQGPSDFHEKYEGTDLTASIGELGRTDTYEKYLVAHQDAPLAEASVPVDILQFEGDAQEAPEHPGCVYQPDGSTVTFQVDVPQSGMYRLKMDYLTVQSRGVDMERSLLINGTAPFSGATQLTFTRLWTDAGPVRQDNQGNDIRPSQVEVFDWQTAYLKDDMGYETEPYRFYFEKGLNTVSLKAVNEPMIIGALELVPVEKTQTYAEYAQSHPAVSMTESARAYQQIVQGEQSTLRSSPSLYARYDRSSPATEPCDVTHTVLNYIGGDPWNNAGQWIEWQFDVPEDGLYSISIKARQSYQRGALSCRNFYLDGVAPFQEVETLSFDYNTSWDMRTLSDAAGKPFQFYLTAGSHTVRLEATLGDMGPVLERLEDSIFELNQIYRKILVLTGVNPDRFRDYNLFKVYPDVKDAMTLASKKLYKIVDDTVAITGQKSDRVAVAQTLAVQLEGFVEHEERITQSFSNFKDNITSLGTAMQNMAETKLDVDMLVVSGENAKLPSVNDGFLAKAFHEIRSCVASYFVDYNSLGDKFDENTEDLIEVWIVTGRDQSTILKTMVDDTFTPMTGIHANVKLVVADTLLTAVVAGNGPDVVLSVGSWFPVNYAMRHAVEDLTQFPDYEQVVAPFYESALAPMVYEGGVYALPETQEYSVLFYREDVLEELGLPVPDTWDDLIALLPTIQGNNMSVGIPYPDIANADLSILNSMIYQNGGQIYDTAGKKTLIDNEQGVKAFKLYTSLYNDYGLPTVYDFVSRFRSGEMPIGVAPYSTYNTLTVSAPEIRGLWDFALFPGTLVETSSGETVDRSVHCAGLCSMIIATDDQKVKENSWEFLKWWISSEAQVRFGREIESVLGSSARYTTANRTALDQLAWSADQLSVLKEQMASTVGFREIAGGYSTTRHMTNAIRKVINDKDDARETLLTYSKTINEEIRVKRQEFNMEVD